MASSTGPIEKLEEQADPREEEEIPPGATRVYRVIRSSTFHVDPGCTYLPPRIGRTNPRIEVYTLATAVNWPFFYRDGCSYCTPSRDALRAVVREHDEYPPDVDVQGTIADYV